MITNAPVAIKLFDTLVNIGPVPAIKIAQRVIDIYHISFIADGILGPKTAEQLNIIRPMFFHDNYRTVLRQHYERLVVINPKLKPNLVGWLKRANS